MSGTDGIEAAPAALATASVKVRDSFARVCEGSDFVARALRADASLFAHLVESADLERSLSAADFAARAPPVPADTTAAEARWMAELRRWRRREFVRIAWRDLANWAPLTETLRQQRVLGALEIADAAQAERRQPLGRLRPDPL